MKHLMVLIVIVSLIVFPAIACQAFAPATQATPTGTAPALPVAAGASTDVVEPTQNVSLVPPPAPELVPLEDTLVQLYEAVNPGVVSIRVIARTGSGSGSGFVIDQDGHIVTNFHVIEDASEIEVHFPSGFKTRGQVLGTDTDSDLAVVKVEVPPEELHPLTLGDSSQIRVGQTVFAIGNPFEFSGTMTVGIISGRGRTLDSLREAPEGRFFTAGDLIQTDAAINPGNSGGPLLNLNGEVIGVNRAIRTFNFTIGEEPLNSGIGFAVAVNIVKRVVPALIADGEYDYPYLGISSLPEITLLQQEALGLPRATGAYVTSVSPGSPAEEAGVRGADSASNLPNTAAGGDLIIAIDGNPVRQFNELLNYLINNKSPGDTVVLTVLRGDDELDIEITLGKRP